jgi:hypothetical protein
MGLAFDWSWSVGIVCLDVYTSAWNHSLFYGLKRKEREPKHSVPSSAGMET